VRVSDRRLAEFDTVGLFEALDGQRLQRGLSWRGVADEMWAMSAVLNAQRDDHPISPSTLTGMARRRVTSCQHALFMLRWLDRSPESFLVGGSAHAVAALPWAGPDRRLRWNLGRLHQVMDAERRVEGLTWVALAGRLQCTPSQLTGIRTARFTAGMHIAMAIVQWVGRPSSDFIYAARW
jgi:hypothetical protein